MNTFFWRKFKHDTQNDENRFWIKERIRSGELLRIFSVAFLLFLAPVVGFNPAGHSLILTQPNLTLCMKSYCENTKKKGNRFLLMN